MDYTAIINALDMIWEDRPRLDVRACRDEAYELLNPVLEEFCDRLWHCVNEENAELVEDLSDEEIDLLIDAVADAVGFGVDLYLGSILAQNGKLLSTGRSPADPLKVFNALENKDLYTPIIDKFVLTPLILRDFSLDLLLRLSEEIDGLSEFSFLEVDNLRQTFLEAASTSFIFTAMHLEGLYKPNLI